MKSTLHADSRPYSKEVERRNRRLHLMLQAKPKSKGMSSLLPGQIEGSQRTRIEGLYCPNRSIHFSFLYFVLSLHFIAIQYGCNNVVFIFCIFIAFVQMLVIRMYGKIKPISRNLKFKDKMHAIKHTIHTHAPLG